MTDKLRESVSALMDDEANELELHRILASMEENDEVRETWKRYQTTSSVMKGSLPQAKLDFDISSQVAAAIADEEIEVVDGGVVANNSGLGRFVKPLTSLAVAASVAFVVVFGALQVNQSPDGVQPGLAEQTTTSDQLETVVASAGTSTQQATPVSDEALTASEKRLRALIDSHTEQVDISRGRAFMPSTQLVNDTSETKRY